MESLNSQIPVNSSAGKTLEDLETFSDYSNTLPSPEGNTRPVRLLKSKPNMTCRRKREFISDEKKDASYWEKRRKNNEAAKRSREKRRLNDMVLENRVIALNDENVRLKTELLQLKLRFGLISAASYMEKSQQIGGTVSGTTGGSPSSSSSSSSSHFYPNGYSTGSHVVMNSDSSEAEQSGLGEGHTQLVKYSPRGSLSDMSDGSSSDSPEPMIYDIKQEGAGLETEIANGTTTQIMFNMHRELPTPHHQHAFQSGYHNHQQQCRHQETIVSAVAPPLQTAQRSVILYRSRSISYPIESSRSQETAQQNLPQNLPQSTDLQSTSTESLAEVTKQLERKTLDSPPYEYADGDVAERQVYRTHHQRPTLDAQKADAMVPDLLHRQEEVDEAQLFSISFPSVQDDEPPVLTYEGGPRNEGYYQGHSGKDTSSSDGDPRSSDKDASTDDECPSSSCSDTGSYHQQSPLVGGPNSSPQSQSRESQAEVKGTALPHKLRLKHRALSNGGTATQELPMTPPAYVQPLPQHPYLALPQSSQQPQAGKEREGQQTTEFCKHPISTEERQDCGKKDPGACNTRNKRNN
ncbi:nuclear factor, interleukin 3 regulated, member 2 [Electrophorus electricus]|uniref:BZIP domain-containing protein n=1 Tax=Electrophorus electricus TaxID=8005 RepID=A0A4W4GN76_ELEEL|nr:nuclear factor, interleukin 3 regulated, member 2 [Electrophorus electricus]